MSATSFGLRQASALQGTRDLDATGVSHFSALKTASQRENNQKILENAITGWVIVLEEYGVMESIPTYASR